MFVQIGSKTTVTEITDPRIDRLIADKNLSEGDIQLIVEWLDDLESRMVPPPTVEPYDDSALVSAIDNLEARIVPAADPVDYSLDIASLRAELDLARKAIAVAQKLEPIQEITTHNTYVPRSDRYLWAAIVVLSLLLAFHLKG